MIVGFRHRAVHDLEVKTLGKLKSMGFVVGDANAWVTPRRTGLDLPAIKNRTAVYIGVGCKGLHLDPSRWGLLLAKGPFANRRQQMELFERDLRANDMLMAMIPSLEGCCLSCHCLASQRCHGDVLVKLFLEMKGAILDPASIPPPYGGRSPGSSKEEDSRPVIQPGQTGNP